MLFVVEVCHEDEPHAGMNFTRWIFPVASTPLFGFKSKVKVKWVNPIFINDVA